jgi:hypothetical protein
MGADDLPPPAASSDGGNKPSTTSTNGEVSGARAAAAAAEGGRNGQGSGPRGLQRADLPRAHARGPTSRARSPPPRRARPAVGDSILVNPDTPEGQPYVSGEGSGAVGAFARPARKSAPTPKGLIPPKHTQPHRQPPPHTPPTHTTDTSLDNGDDQQPLMGGGGVGAWLRRPSQANPPNPPRPPHPSLPQIAWVKEILAGAGDDGEDALSVVWYYRPEEAVGGRKVRRRAGDGGGRRGRASAEGGEASARRACARARAA